MNLRYSERIGKRETQEEKVHLRVVCGKVGERE